MSWRAYELLTIQPDFTSPPQHGLGEGGLTLVEFGQATSVGTWHGDTALAMSFDFRFDTAAEQRSIRNLTNILGGRAMPFFMPSWEHDFVLAEAGIAGDVQIRIEAAGLSSITDNRPDTEGRQIFLVRPDGQVQGVGIVGAVLEGSEEVLTLDLPLAFDVQPDQVMVGLLRLMRLADDRIEYRQERPGHGLVKLAMVTSRQTRHVNDSPAVEGENIFNLKAFVDVIATDEDPMLLRYKTATAIGPEVYGSAQTDNFYRDWTAYTDGPTVKMQNSAGGAPIPSDLYDSGFETQHLTFGFDGSGREAIAWRSQPGLIRLGYKAGGVNHWKDFPGISPVMIQTWALDSTVTAGNADLVVFYLREGFSGIFARFYREDFATERLIVKSPVCPIYLQLARGFQGRIEVVGMDSGHRLCRWRTSGYLTPMERQAQIGKLSPIVTGQYRSLVVFAFGTDSQTGRMGGLVTGEYRSIRVYQQAPEIGEVGRMGGLVTGSYTSVRIYVNPSADGQTGRLATTVPGEYKLVRRLGAAEDAQIGKLSTTVTGSYGP